MSCHTHKYGDRIVTIDSVTSHHPIYRVRLSIATHWSQYFVIAHLSAWRKKV